MTNQTANAKVKVRTQTAVSTATGTKSAIMVTGFAAAVTGVWALTCFMSAIMSSGPVGMIQGWFAAVAGM